MNQSNQLRVQISQLDLAGLNLFWGKLIQREEIPGWPPGKALEYLILRAFELGGASVTCPYTVTHSGMVVEQIDGTVYYEHLSCLIEC